MKCKEDGLLLFNKK